MFDGEQLPMSSGLLDGKTMLGVVCMTLRFLADYYGNDVATLPDMVVLAVRIATDNHVA